MQAQSSRHADAAQTLFTGPDAALVSVSVPGWANSLLIQLLRCPVGMPKAFSLYTLDREGSVTFEATVQFDIGESRSPLERLLIEFVRSGDYVRAVLEPLARQVQRHFHR